MSEFETTDARETDEAMTDAPQDESLFRRIERVVGTVLLHGLPAFRTGDRVVIMDDAIRTILGDETGTVEAVECPFYGWEYRLVADNPDPDGWLPNVQPEGELLTADQIERYADGDGEQADGEGGERR